MAEENHLNQLIATIATGPTQNILSYLDEYDIAIFFSLSSHFHDYKKNAYLYQVDVFINHLTTELKQPQGQPWWKHRNSHCTLEHFMRLSILLPYLVSLGLSLKIGIQLYTVRTRLQNIIYTSDPS